MSSAASLDGHNRPPTPNPRSGRSKSDSEPRTSAQAKAKGKTISSKNASNRASKKSSKSDADRSEWTDPQASEQARRAAQARQSSGRRRRIDPTTCERDYSGDELEFMQAMQAYKQSSGRMFPTWSEVLEVLLELGYTKTPNPGPEESSADSGAAS